MTKKKTNRTTIKSSKKKTKDTFPKGYENLSIEEKIPFLIVKCISSMTDFDPRRYGKKRVCDILKGTRSKFVLENGHHHSPCYGALKGLSRGDIYHFINGLIGAGSLRVEDETFPTLEITTGGEQVLDLKRKVRISFPLDLDPESIPAFDYEMYTHLYDVRLVQAKDEGVPPYCVLPNDTLVELCVRSPKHVDDLEGIRGFGPARTQKYGELFIRALSAYSSEKKAK